LQIAYTNLETRISFSSYFKSMTDERGVPILDEWEHALLSTSYNKTRKLAFHM